MTIKIPYVLALLIAAPISIYKRRAGYLAHRHDFDVRHEVILSLLFAYGLVIAAYFTNHIAGYRTFLRLEAY